MKSNIMSSLTKKLLLFLVFSIISNFVTSDDKEICKNETQDETEVCINDLKEVFIYDKNPLRTFPVVMLGFSINLIDSFFTSTQINRIYDSFNSYGIYIKSLRGLPLNTEHRKVLTYFNNLRSWKKNHENRSENEIKADIFNYYYSFADQIEVHAEIIDDITKSPQVFCISRKDKDDCIKALCTLLAVNDIDFKTMTASQALRHCYLNYTYLDFITKNSIEIEYFKYLADMVKRLNEFNKITKKSSNEGTSDGTNIQECTNNVHEIFFHDDPHHNFSMAMTALSVRKMTIDFIAKNADELYSHFALQYDKIKPFISSGKTTKDGISDNAIFDLKHTELLEYLENLKNWQRFHKHSTNDTPFTEIHADVMGYFVSFAQKIEEIAERIDDIMWKPKVYCDNNKEPDECKDALRIMLNREDAMEMKGSEALIYCYLNYTYLDFTKEQIFPESANSSSSSSSSSSVEQLSEQLDNLFLESGYSRSSSSSSVQPSNKKLQVYDAFKSYYLRQMIDYYSYLLDVTTQIGEFNKALPDNLMGYNPILRVQFVYKKYQDPPIFLTIHKYCKTAVKNRSRKNTSNKE